MSLAETAFTLAERLQAYDERTRLLVPAWQREFFLATQQMKKALPAAADPNGSLKDLATFILAANASHNAQMSLLSAAKLAREVHPMAKARFGT